MRILSAAPLLLALVHLNGRMAQSVPAVGALGGALSGTAPTGAAAKPAVSSASTPASSSTTFGAATASTTPSTAAAPPTTGSTPSILSLKATTGANANASSTAGAHGTLANGTTVAANATTTANATTAANATSLAAKTSPNEVLPPGCKRMCHRREIRALSGDERKALWNALLKLNSGSKPTKYDLLVNIHVTNSPYIHNNDMFLVWHRSYLRTVEIALQEIDPTVCLPYWRWDLDSQAIEASIVLSPEWYGGHGTGADTCVTDGAFAHWHVQYPQPGCLRRKYKYGDRVGAVPSTEIINRVLSESDSYVRLRPGMEKSIHPYLHNQIGGHLLTMASPNDPIFWLHHGLVDQIWWQWQQIDEDRATSFGGSKSDGSPLTASDELPGLSGALAGGAISTKSLCYDYTEATDADINGDFSADFAAPGTKDTISNAASGIIAIKGAAAGAGNTTDREDLTALRHLDPVSEDFIAMNGWDVADIRQRETESNTIYDKLNAIKGYVSPCSLWKRPQLVDKIAKTVTKFTASIPGIGKFSLDKGKNHRITDQLREWRDKLTAAGVSLESSPTAYADELTNIIGTASYATSPGAAGAIATKRGNLTSGAAMGDHIQGIPWILLAIALSFW